MWIFTRYGFFSVARQESFKPDALYFIRARDVNHLKALQLRFASLRTFPILVNNGTDYPFRINVTAEIWPAVMKELAEEQTWYNFKYESEMFSKVGKSNPRETSWYIQSLHAIWTMLRNRSKYCIVPLKGCINVNHNDASCIIARFPKEKWCANCTEYFS